MSSCGMTLFRYGTLFAAAVAAAAATVASYDEELELDAMKVMLLQSKLQLRTAVDQGSSRSSFISGVDLLELRVRALEAKLDRVTASSGTPWLFLPIEAVFSLIRKFGDFIGDLFLHPRGHAWQQLMVFCICTAGVVASGMSVNSQRWCEHMGGKLPSLVFGIAVGTASLAIVGSICHPLIPWMLLAVLCVLARTPKAERADKAEAGR